MPRDNLKKIVGDPKRFTAYDFVERVEKMTGMKYSEPHAHRLLRSLGFSAKKVSKTADHVQPRSELETWQKDTEKGVEAFENDDFILTIAKSHQNSNIFGSGAVYVRGDAEPVPTQPGRQRQTVYGGATPDGQTCFMMAKKANNRSFIRYLDKLWRRLGKLTAIVDNSVPRPEARAAVSGRKRRSCKTTVLATVLTVPEPGKRLWRKGKARIRRILRRPAKSYRQVLLVYESLEIRPNPRNILFRNPDKIFPI